MTLQERIKQHEGLSLTIYPDVLGYSTIGYGHKCSSAEIQKYKDGITKEEAEAIFQDDFAKKSAQAKAIAGDNWKKLNEARQGVIIEMVFQLGMGGVLKFKRMWAAIDAGDYDEAAAQMIESVWHKQTRTRCEDLAAIMKHGVA